MENQPITKIIRYVRFFRPEDQLKKIVGVMQATGAAAFPVVDDGRFIGMVSEADMLKYMAAHPEEEDARVSEAVNREAVYGNVHMTLQMVAEVMTSAHADVLAVVDEFGSYRGIVTRKDVLAEMFGVVKAPVIAGLATPLGVRLTTGNVTAGAGNLGLYLSGVAMGVMVVAAIMVIYGLALGIDALFGTTLMISLKSPSTGTQNGAFGADLVNTLSAALIYVLVLFFIRLSPISAYHAAEHQVVHTIEAGEPLTPDVVRMMPRAHPRCGTNLMVAAVLFAGALTIVGQTAAVMLAIVFVLFGWWRSLGYYLQQYFTTKPPGPRQVQNGIKVGEELLEKVRRGQVVPVSGVAKVWNMGLPQVLLGLLTVMPVLSLLVEKLGILL